jgi:hypothetical protein
MAASDGPESIESEVLSAVRLIFTSSAVKASNFLWVMTSLNIMQIT